MLMQNVYADSVSLSNDANKLKTFVDSGIDYIKKYGTKKAYAEISNPQGKFIRTNPNLYLFVYNFNGVCLAHGFMPSRIGKNFLNEVDVYGTPTTKLASTIAKLVVVFLPYTGQYQEQKQTKHALKLFILKG